MNIHDVDINWEDVQSHIVGAGVLPIHIDAHNNITMLLGKERYILNWRSSLKWSGFEGGRKPNETVENAAAREFFEESLGVIRIVPDEDPTVESIRKFLYDGHYFARILLCIVHNEILSECRYHVTYVIQIPTQRDDIIETFTQKRHDALVLQQQIQTLNSIQRCVMSNVHLPIEGCIYKGHRVEHIQSVDYDSTGTHVQYKDSVGEHTVTLNDSMVHVSQYREWFQLRSHIIHNPSFLYTQSIDELGSMNITFNDEYTEKSAIKYWDLDVLSRVLGNRGHVDTHSFRAYFLPTLQRALLELKKYSS